MQCALDRFHRVVYTRDTLREVTITKLRKCDSPMIFKHSRLKRVLVLVPCVRGQL